MSCFFEILNTLPYKTKHDEHETNDYDSYEMDTNMIMRNNMFFIFILIFVYIL